MSAYEKVSTGLKGMDRIIDQLRLGDNVVWQVNTVADYSRVVEPYVAQAKQDKRRVIYVRFGSHEPLLQKGPGVKIHNIDAKKGFERFALAVHRLIEREGRKVFYVFDCLTYLLEYWYSDLMIGNFFKVTCPFLYELEAVAYFAIIRNVHTSATVAGIRETTQLLLDIYQLNNNFYVHPLKASERYSPTMFFPHLIEGQEAFCITASTEAARLFSGINRGEEKPDYWNIVFNRAKKELSLPPEQQKQTKKLLCLC